MPRNQRRGPGKRLASGPSLVQVAEQAGLLTDADRETLRVEGADGERSIVADRLFSLNSLVSLCLLVSGVWALRNPAAFRRAWQAAVESSMGWPLPGRRGR